MRKFITIMTMTFAMAITFVSCATTSNVTEQPRKNPDIAYYMSQYKLEVAEYQQAKKIINSTFEHIEDPEVRKINERFREAKIISLPSYIDDIKWTCDKLDNLEVEHVHWQEIVEEAE